MAVLTERITVTMPAEQKQRLKLRAQERGISSGALMRDMLDDLIAEHDLAVTIAELERRDGATVQ